MGGRLHASLAAANVNPLAIDQILLTHAHPDHIGGLVGALPSAPQFPNAEIVMHDAEFAFWTDDANLDQAPDPVKPFFHAARAVFEAYGARRRTVSAGQVAPGIEIEHLPGHTPGIAAIGSMAAVRPCSSGVTSFIIRISRCPGPK
ncbi:MBL fold metallo-hydrolase [Bradyrhizobium japonicum]